MDREAVSSAAQDQWEEIAAGVRAGLAKLVEQVPAMTPAEVKDLVGALDDAQWFESKVACWDKGVETQARILERRAAFGDGD